jgi:hypothetical protein
MPRSALLFVAMLVTFPCVGQQPPAYGVLMDGRPITALATPGTRAVALFFVASDCPISNRTFAEMKRLRQQFTPRGVQFWFVYPNRGEVLAEVKSHQQAYDPDGAAILDTTGTLLRMTGAIVTPEVSILVPETKDRWRSVYTGRIDDRYVRIGLERPQATQRFAEQALTAMLEGRAIPAPTGTPVGCAIIPAAASRPQ